MPSWAGLLASRDKPYREKIMAALSSKAGSSGCNKTPTQDNFGTTSAATDPAGNRVPLQTMRPVGARIADDAVNVCDVVAHTRWTVSTTTSVRRTSRTSFSSKGGSDLTFGV